MSAGIRELLRDLERDKSFSSCVTAWRVLPAAEGSYAGLPDDLDPRLRAALQKRGLTSLYTHQARSYEEARAGRSLTVVTPTASGKTLCYSLPVLQAILEKPERRALFLFPTKALSQDQQSELNEAIMGGELPVKAATYDGDTPASLRVSARETGQLIISNPDMLHAGILPNHTKWIKFLKALSFVVIDELHSYRGVFGSHMANLIRRLKRLAEFYGSSPQFICTSATIGNPGELAERVTGEKMVLIRENGAPRGEKHVILYNPPLVDRVQGMRRGVVLESQKLALKFLESGIKTIVFTRSRIQSELVAGYIRDKLANVFNDDHRIRVESYRGGYLPSERRAIEAGLRDGSVHGVVSTNALELGIDIGGLDAAVLAGFPGSISSSWQQAGRAGRRQGVSAAVLIASNGPLDQFMVNNPDYFLGVAPESGFIDPDNPYILMDHLRCTVFELPFRSDEAFGGRPAAMLGLLEESGVVRKAADVWYWADRSYPAESVSLRSASSENVVIIDATGGRNAVIGEMDRPSAKELIFPNAVYLHRGAQFMVKQLDLGERRCTVEESTVNYYTDAIVKRDIKVLREDERGGAAGLALFLGDILVRSQVTKFKKIRFHSHENIGYGDISLPEEEMHTRSLALLFEPGGPGGALLEALDEDLRAQVVIGLGYLVRGITPLYLLCDQRDLGVSERLRDPHFRCPALYFFDMYPGGTGLAEKMFERIAEILAAARGVVEACACADGCPSCIGPRDSKLEISSSPKGRILDVLRCLSGG